jgi:uncharacterized protein YijF (DUF1287 family)
MKSLLLFFGLITHQALFAQSPFYGQLADSALTLTKQRVTYDPTYVKLKYPNGDVPADNGVRTDVVIRAYRYRSLPLWGLVGRKKNAWQISGSIRFALLFKN